MQKSVLRLLVPLLLLASMIGSEAGKKPAPRADLRATVTAITPGSDANSATIAIKKGSPFAVDSNTTIIIDGQKATLADIHVGMKVLTRTTPGSSAPEIDLKTMPKGGGE